MHRGHQGLPGRWHCGQRDRVPPRDDLCNIGLVTLQASGMNPYDMRIKCAVPPLCYDFSNVGVYPHAQRSSRLFGVESQAQMVRLQ